MLTQVGKRVVDDLYVHTGALGRAYASEQVERIRAALVTLPRKPDSSELENGRLFGLP